MYFHKRERESWYGNTEQGGMNIEFASRFSRFSPLSLGWERGARYRCGYMPTEDAIKYANIWLVYEYLVLGVREQI